MNKWVFLLCFLLFGSIGAAAQKYVVSGKVQDSQTQEAVEFATVALLRSDSSIAVNGATDEKGNFKLNARAAGKYTLKVSYLGYTTYRQTIELTSRAPKSQGLVVPLKSMDQMLGTAVVTATASKVAQKEDTTMFNASAYRVPEGSTLEALIEQLPGVEVDENGTITWNGKEVKEFLVNGKDFFKGDKDVAMKNLPTDLISKIKAYDKKSDYTEQTGIDDGNETTVLDISTKQAMKESWISNLDAGYGTDDRYSLKFFGSRFTDLSRVSAFASLNNVNDRGFRGWRSQSGLTARKNAGLDFSWENTNEKRAAGRLEFGGSANYSHVGNDVLTRTSSETFLSSGAKSSFANSVNRNSSSNTNFGINFRAEWNPDTMTNIRFRPSFGYSNGDSDGDSRSATFNDDPYAIEGMVSPLDSIFLDNPPVSLKDIAVNSNLRSSLSDNKSYNVNGSLNMVRRFNALGRNISLNVDGGYSESESNSFSISNIVYFNGQPKDYLNQYSTTPSKNWNYRVQVGYAEPLTKNLFAEARYSYAYRFNDSNRSRYNLDEILNDPNYVWNIYENCPAIGTLPSDDEILNAVRDDVNSQYATYRHYNQQGSLGLRYNTKEIRMNASLGISPEKTKMEYERPGQNIDTLVIRKVTNLSPQLRFRYRFSDTKNLDIRYNGRSSQPSMTDLLEVVDNSNPLSVSMGNPGLKPSWNNDFTAYYNGYNVEQQRGISAGVSYSQTKNSVSNLLVFDEATGISYTRPENINGNWNTGGHFMINTGLGEEKNFTISSFSMARYKNSVGFVSTFNSDENPVTGNPDGSDLTYYNKIFDAANIEKNITRSLSLRESLRFSYRNDWFDVGVIGRGNYNHARSEQKENANLDTWTYAYGANANFNFDWGMSFTTDLTMNSRRGFSEASMNTDELIWNVQISQSFLKRKEAVVSLQIFDILKQQSNVSRTINAMQRSDSWNNSINSYAMLHFIYKLNIFGGKRGGPVEKGERGRHGGPAGFGGGHAVRMRM